MLTRRHLLAYAALLAVGSRVVFVASPANAQSAPADAAAFIRGLGDKALAAFSSKDLPRAEAVDRFKALVSEGFDVPYIGRFVVGRYWRAATSAERDEYQALFERMIVETYANRFLEYSGETFEVLGSQSAGENDSLVSSRIVRPYGPPVNVEWRVRKTPQGFRIIDVAVEGVSMAITQRSEFASVIESSGGRFGGLLDALRQRLGRG